MMTIMTTSTIILLICLLLMMLNNMISKKSFQDREKTSPFECGFDPKSTPRIPFSLHFFLIAMIFLVFDVEITLLMPIIYTMKTSSPLSFMYTFITFIFILLLGTIHEWKQGSLNWSN